MDRFGIARNANNECSRRPITSAGVKRPRCYSNLVVSLKQPHYKGAGRIGRIGNDVRNARTTRDAAATRGFEMCGIDHCARNIRRLFGPPGVNAEYKRQRPRRNVVEPVIFLRLPAPAHLVAAKPRHIVVHKRFVLRRVLLEERLYQDPLRLVEIDNIRTRRKRAASRRRVLVHVTVSRRGRKRCSCSFYLDIAQPKNVDHLRRLYSVRRRVDDHALQSRAGTVGHSPCSKVVKIPKPLNLVLRRRLKRCHRRDVVFRDRRTERHDRPVVARPPQPLRPAAIRLVRHSRRPVEARIHVPIPRIERIEHVANVVIPLVRIKCSRIRATVNLKPFVVLWLRQVRVDRQRDRREKVLRRLAVMIDRDLRVPFHVRPLHVARFFL